MKNLPFFCIFLLLEVGKGIDGMASSLLLVSPLAAGGDDDDLASLLEATKTAGLAHERELALLAGRAAIAETAIDGGGHGKRGATNASREWCRHALCGALRPSESRECRRWV